VNALIAAAAEFGSEDRTVSGVVTVDVEPTDWRAALGAVLRAGGTYLDVLAGADLAAEGLQIVAHVMTETGNDAVLVRTIVPGATPELPGVGDLWAGATWHEREITDLYGITFTDSADDRPLLTDRVGPPPLLKSTLLAARQDGEWPGSFDPADKPGAKKRLPPGVEDPA
jgi:NADH:ubiquinone oxidoreductase subunit C